MDKLIIEFNKKFDKQKQELIDGFKALGEEKRLPKALATIEGEQPTYKNYFKAGWQSRQAEVDEYKMVSESIEDMYLLVQKRIEEKDKRIKQALSELESLHNKKWAEWKEQADMHSQGEANAYEHAIQILERVLRGEHE